MTPSAATTTARSVGDILHHHGYITAEQLEEALDRQRRTGQPLGQILVESGAITRLELASALAEQWSDAPHLVRMEPPARGAQPAPAAMEPSFELSPADAGAIDELRAHAHAFAARLAAIEVRAGSIAELHERLVEVRQMVSGLADWASGPELRLAELEGRVSTFAPLELLDGVSTRLETAESAISSFGERVEQVIAAIGGAINQLEEESTKLSASVELLAGRLDASATADELAEVRALVDELVARPAVDPGLEQHVATLADRLAALEAGVVALGQRADTATTGADVEQLREEIQSVAARMATAADAALVAALREELGMVAERVESAADAAGLAALREEVGGVAERVDALAGRVESAPDAAELAALREGAAGVAERVETLAAQVGSAAGAVDVAVLRDELGAVSARIDGLETRLERTADGAALDDVRLRLEEIAARPSVDPELAARLDELAVRVEAITVASELSELRAAVEEIAARPAGDPVRMDVLADRVADLTARLDGVAVSADGKVDASVVSELRAAVEELAARPQVDLALADEVREIAATLEGLAPAAALSRVRDEVEGLAAGIGDLARSASVDELREELAALADRPAADPALAGRVEALAARVDALAVTTDGSVDAVVVTELRTRLDELAERPAGDRALAEKVEALAAEIARRAGEEVPSVPDPEPRLLELAERIAALERLPRPEPQRTDGSAIAEVAGRVEELSSRLEAVALAAASAPVTAGGEPSEGELDKIRVSVESLWMRMAEFQRSVAALLDPRGLGGKLDMLEARLDAVEAGGGRGGGPGIGSGDVREIAQRIEEMETAAASARETLLTRLEKMASTIDWRLQRLETPSE